MTSWVVVTKCGCRRLFKEANESFFLLHQVLTKAGLSERTDHIQIFLPSQFSTVVPTISQLRSRAAAARVVVTHCRKVFICVTGQNCTCAPRGGESPKYIHTVYDFCHPHSLGFVRLWSNIEGKGGRRRGIKSDVLSDPSNDCN